MEKEVKEKQSQSLTEDSAAGSSKEAEGGAKSLGVFSFEGDIPMS